MEAGRLVGERGVVAGSENSSGASRDCKDGDLIAVGHITEGKGGEQVEDPHSALKHRKHGQINNLNRLLFLN
jgi:hypothetical protein